MIAVFACGKVVSRMSRNGRARRLLGHLPFWRRFTAVLRYLSYRSFRLESLAWESPPLGVMLLIVAGVVYFSSNFSLSNLAQPFSHR